MNREALIIYCEKSKYGDLPGAKADAKAWNTFLQNPTGGSWFTSEITTVASPTKSWLDRKLVEMRDNADIAFIAFSGHGFHRRVSTIDASFICINDKDDYKVSDLNCGVDRVMIIADTCRGIEPVTEQYSVNASLRKSARAKVSTRARYEKAFQQAEKGAIFLYACDIDESAGDDEVKGGYFSSSLIRTTTEWASTASLGGVRDARKAFDEAYAFTNALAPQQHPVYNGGRRMRHFPFGVT